MWGVGVPLDDANKEHITRCLRRPAGSREVAFARIPRVKTICVFDVEVGRTDRVSGILLPT